MNASLAWERKLKKLGVPVPADAQLGVLEPPAKYRARATTVDGIRFDSAKEARRYQELKLLEKADEIRDLELQPRYPLSVRPKIGSSSVIGDYVADFRYRDTTGASHIEDVKGYRTPLFRWKKKHAELQYGIVIHEI